MAVAAALALSGSAAAQTLRGMGELQYQSIERVGTGSLRETWIKTFETDYSRRLPGSVELSSRFRFTEQTVARERDRLRAPEGSVRLAHRFFGISSAYRPTEARDAVGLTQRQQSLTLNGYVQKPGLPSLTGSWVRSHVDSSTQARGTATVTRNLGAIYNTRGLGLRAGYGDRRLDPDDVPSSRLIERHLTLGSISQFQLGRAPVSVQYDFTQGWADPSGTRAQRSRSHTAGGSSSYAFGARTSSSLSYTYRRAGVLDAPGTTTEDHNGALSLSHILTPAFALSSGVGVRSATFGGRTLTERFATAGASARGDARPGWSVGAAAGRTYNWLPGSSVRTSDNFGSNTSMRLARGLDARADFSISASDRVQGTADSLGTAREVGLQFGAGMTAQPLRTVHLDANAHRSRAGRSTLRGSPTSTSYSAAIRLTPSPRLQMGGGWGLIRGLGSRGSTGHATLLWAPGARFQMSGTYSRARQRTPAGDTLVTTLQESVTGSVTTALRRDLNASFRYSESGRGLPTHTRQIGVALVQRFGR